MKIRKSIVNGVNYKEPENVEEWFQLNSPWCPLFGELPLYGSLGLQDEVESPARDACIEIIRQARSLWKIEPAHEIEPLHRLGWPNNSWPEVDRLTYPAGKLILARIIFNAVGAIEIDPLFIQMKDPKTDQFMNYDKQAIEPVFDEVCKRVLQIARSRTDQNVKDSGILSIFGIWMSWRVLRELLLKGVEETKLWIQNQIRIAGFLIDHCYYIERNEVIDGLKSAPRIAGAKGGKVPKKKIGILMAIEWAKGRSKHPSARGLWNYFKKNRFEQGEYEVYFYCDPTGAGEDLLCQKIDEVEKGSVKFETFKKYVYSKMAGK